MLTYLFWPLFCAALAYMQGTLLPAVRRTPPGAEADRQAFGLHEVGYLAYLLPCVLVQPLALAGVAHQLVAALLSRALLFDPVLNLGSGQPLFYVGQTAAADRALQWLAARTGWSAEHVRLTGWLLALGLATGYLLLIK